ncbi:hypothetical protein [Jiella pelagia]|uniref:hypothetical protein n=1 Tax=Jiella pelagia TaxID=2986949 RepID=UPI0022A77923|nr:hypothetical protein [Jiella pelagia]
MGEELINHVTMVRDRLATAFPIPQSTQTSLLERNIKAGTRQTLEMNVLLNGKKTTRWLET